MMGIIQRLMDKLYTMEVNTSERTVADKDG